MYTAICEERTHLFSPNINIAIMLELPGRISSSSLQTAICAAQQNNEILNTLITLEETGAARYCQASFPCPILVERQENWQKIVEEQAKQPFHLAAGELVRYFFIPAETSVRLLLIAHHLAGDGLSIAFLAEDILSALAGKPLRYRPFLPSARQQSSLSPLLQFGVKRLNRSWEKQGKIFSWEEYHHMFRQYWQNRAFSILRQSIPAQELQLLLRRSKQEGITLNSCLTTAFFRAAATRCDLGLAVSVRPEGDRGMGNHASGISVRYRYQEAKSFWDNARQVHRLIYQKLNCPEKKYFLLNFLSALNPTLVDAAYFSAYGGYRNRTARTVQGMFGYSGNPKGLSVTNLGNLSALEKSGEISDFAFVPPLVPNAKRLFGIASLNGGLQITFCAQPEEVTFFHAAMDCLLKIQ